VTARSVVERTREVGIRIALGGNPLDVWWTVAWGSVKAVIAGAIAGVAASVLAGAALTALLPEVESAAWRFAAACAAGLVVVGVLAAMVAARGAVAVDPLTALKDS
jgi:ABC-type lipoprotein release transport system permease subunit